MTRRKFATQLGAAIASLLLLPGLNCNKTSDLIGNLRGILQQVEKALAALSILSGLLPDAVNQAAKYLLAVVAFVHSVAEILENETIAAVDRIRQILTLAGDVVMPVVPPPIGPILAAVAAAVDKFLSFFGTDVAHARSTPMSNPPNLTLSQKDKNELEAIERDAEKDKTAVEDWQKRATAQPHSQREYHKPEVWLLG